MSYYVEMGNYMRSFSVWWYSINKDYLEPLASAERSDSPTPPEKTIYANETSNHALLTQIDEAQNSDDDEDTIEL